MFACAWQIAAPGAPLRVWFDKARKGDCTSGGPSGGGQGKKKAEKALLAKPAKRLGVIVEEVISECFASVYKKKKEFLKLEVLTFARVPLSLAGPTLDEDRLSGRLWTR